MITSLRWPRCFSAWLSVLLMLLLLGAALLAPAALRAHELS